MGGCTSCIPHVWMSWLSRDSSQRHGTPMIFRYHQGMPYAVKMTEQNLGGLPGYVGLVQKEPQDVGLNAPLIIESWPQFRIGTSLWPSGVLLARALATDALDLRKSLSGARVLELGAGVGLPSMVCAKKGAREVCITDCEDLVPLIKNNLAINSPWEREIYAKVLDWSNAEASGVTESTWDFVIAADVVYVEEQDPLLDAIQAVCRAGTTLVLAYRERSMADRAYLNTRILPAFASVRRSAYAFEGSSCELYICSTQDDNIG